MFKKMWRSLLHGCTQDYLGRFQIRAIWINCCMDVTLSARPPSVSPFVCLSIHKSILPSIHTFNSPPIGPFISNCPSAIVATYPSLCLCPSICTFTCPSDCYYFLSLCPPVVPSSCPSTCLHYVYICISCAQFTDDWLHYTDEAVL